MHYGVGSLYIRHYVSVDTQLKIQETHLAACISQQLMR